MFPPGHPRTAERSRRYESDRADRYVDRESNTDWSHQQTFEEPMYEGYRLDWCRERGAECGKPAAEEWTNRLFLNSKSSKVRFEREENVGLTKIVGSGELCTSRGCDGFESIGIGGGSTTPGLPARNRLWLQRDFEGWTSLCRLRRRLLAAIPRSGDSVPEVVEPDPLSHRGR